MHTDRAAPPVRAWRHVVTRSPWERWWRWLWLVAFFGGVVFVIRDLATIEDSFLQLGVLHRPITAGIVGLLLLQSICRRPLVLFRGLMGLLVLFGLWRLLSTLWSPEPLWTLYRSLEYLVIVALAAFTAASLRGTEEFRRWINWLWAFTGTLVATVWLGLVLAPSAAFHPLPDALVPFALSGVFPLINPNSVGTLGGTLALVGIARFVRGESRRVWWSGVILVGGTTMFLAQGRSALAGFVAGFTLILLLHRRIGLIGVLGLTILGAVTLFSADAILWEYFRRGQNPGAFAAFSGRMYFWEFAWENYIRESPWLGYGAFAGPRFLVLGDLGRGTMSTIHSAWVETAIEIGLAGVTLLAVVLIYAWAVLVRHAWSARGLNRAVSVELIAVLALVTVRSFFTTELVLHNSYVFFVAVACASFLQRHSRVRRRPRADIKQVVWTRVQRP